MSRSQIDGWDDFHPRFPFGTGHGTAPDPRTASPHRTVLTSLQNRTGVPIASSKVIMALRILLIRAICALQTGKWTKRSLELQGRSNQLTQAHFRSTHRLTAVLIVVVTLFAPGPLFAQDKTADHASRHPADPASPPQAVSSTGTAMPRPNRTTSPAPGGAMPQMMKGMMAPSGATPGGADGGCCGMSGAKPFYASMMEWPVLTDEARRAVRPQALQRLNSGMVALSAQQSRIHHAMAMDDFADTTEAIAGARESLALAESGSGVLKGLAEGRPPRELALNWLKRETATAGAQQMTTQADLAGLSWWHVIAMAILVAAVVAALISWRARRRRVASLIERLTSGPPSVANAVGPTSASTAPGLTTQKPWKGILRIKAIFQETSTVKTFRLMEPNGGSIPFSFLPGQYATITSEIDGQKVRRSYTISSSPTQGDYIELTIKREQNGLESRHLHDHALTGDLAEISAPAGRFFFTGEEADGIVLIAGGVGITPMMSVLRSLTDRSYQHDMFLLYGVNTPADLIFQEECAYLARRHPRLHVTSVVAKPEGTDWAGPVGYVTAEFIAAAVPDIARRRIHLCGPPPMMAAVKTALEELEVPAEQVRTEDFAPPKGGPVPATDALPLVPGEAGIAPPPSIPVSSAHASITFSGSGKSGPLAPDQSVLEAAEVLGVNIDFECREGTCGRCKVPLREGQVVMEVEDSLSADEKASGIILACQAKSTGNLVVDA